MANMRAIRNRIKSIETTRQIARSMRMVAASKLRRTQENWQKLAYFTAVSRDTLQKLCASADIQRQPLLARREGKRLCLVLIVGSRGLCGAYNSALVKQAQARIAAGEEEVSLVVCGRWGREQIAALGVPVRRVFDTLSDAPDAAEAEAVARYLEGLFLDGETDRVELLYEAYISALSQQPRFLPLLPMNAAGEARGESPRETIYEPDKDTLLARLLELVLLNSVHTALLEAKASEHTARMTAMSAASDNTDELIAKLSVQLNHARQAAITTEIAEIVGGSHVLNQTD